jgi:hypothetical protein
MVKFLMENTISYKRLTTHYTFPEYAHVPGVTPHPNKEGGHSHKVEIKVDKLNLEHIYDNQAYLFSFDLLNCGYYWESHVWLEELWNEEKRIGPLADLFKFFIKIGAAGVKAKMHQLNVALDHLIRAEEILLDITDKNSTEYLAGFNLKKLNNELDEFHQNIKDYVVAEKKEMVVFKKFLIPNK